MLTNLQLSDSGAYSVTVANDWGQVTSEEAPLSVGLVAAWGNEWCVETNVPPYLTNVVAISGGAFQNFALKADGTAIAWGIYPRDTNGHYDLPSDLTNVVAIAAGHGHHLALRADGKVVGWGGNYYGQTDVSPHLTNVVSMAAGGAHSVVLTTEGTVVAWGCNTYGQTNVPQGLGGVLEIAATADYTLALQGRRVRGRLGGQLQLPGQGPGSSYQYRGNRSYGSNWYGPPERWDGCNLVAE